MRAPSRQPGEIRTNWGGCHAHSQQPTPFEKTVKNVEYHRDVRPILERSCVACVTPQAIGAGLALQPVVARACV